MLGQILRLCKPAFNGLDYLTAIAHRLSIVRNAHCIYVMEQGKLVESGRHEELLDQNGIYASLWRVQTGIRE